MANRPQSKEEIRARMGLSSSSSLSSKKVIPSKDNTVYQDELNNFLNTSSENANDYFKNNKKVDKIYFNHHEDSSVFDTSSSDLSNSSNESVSLYSFNINTQITSLDSLNIETFKLIAKKAFDKEMIEKSIEEENKTISNLIKQSEKSKK